MSIQAVAYVLQSARLGSGGAARKLVLIAYANHAGDDGTATFPSVGTVAGYAECDAKTVRRHIGWLIEHGYMREGDQRLVDHYRGDRRPIVYDVAISDDQVKEWAAHQPEDGRRAASIEHGRRSAQVERGDILSPRETAERGDSSVLNGGTVSPERGDTSVRQTVLKPSLEPSSSASLRSAGAQTTIDGAPEPPPQPTTAQDLVGEFIDHCKRRPPDRYLGKLAKATKELLDEGFTPDEIRGGMRVLIDRGLDASVLPSTVHGALNGRGENRGSRAEEKPSGLWRYWYTSCADCGGQVKVNSATNRPDKPHVCSTD
jgi:hypothetical protein